MSLPFHIPKAWIRHPFRTSLAVQSIIGSNSPGLRYGQQSDIPKTSHVKLSQGINIFYERERKRERQGEGGGGGGRGFRRQRRRGPYSPCEVWIFFLFRWAPVISARSFVICCYFGCLWHTPVIKWARFFFWHKSHSSVFNRNPVGLQCFKANLIKMLLITN